MTVPNIALAPGKGAAGAVDGISYELPCESTFGGRSCCWDAPETLGTQFSVSLTVSSGRPPPMRSRGIQPGHVIIVRA